MTFRQPLLSLALLLVFGCGGDDMMIPDLCGGEECGADELCDLDVCRTTCGGRLCADNDTCVDAMCVDGQDTCAAGEFWFGRECRATCGEGDCPEGHVCMLDLCVPSCTTHEDCGMDQVCHRGVCGNVCGTGRGGIEGFECNVTRYPEVLRLADIDYQPSERLAAFGCQVSVERDVDGLCDGDLPFPAVEQPLCDSCLASFGGCGTGQACEHGDCTCGDNNDCPGALVCVEGYCAPCASDAECGCDAYCNLGECRSRCLMDEECPGDNVCSGGHCAGCRQDTDCSGGDRCYQDGCVAPCTPGSDGCHDNGRSSFCTIFETPAPVMACE